MNQRFSIASVLVLAFSLAAAPLLACQMEGHDKMPGMGGKFGMGTGMGIMDKNEMKMMMDNMAAMPPAQRKKVMQKMIGMNDKARASSKPMPGGGMGDDMPGDM